ncbi:hypothetical protein C462_16202, partial [Halorubrum distributum JCM 13916]
MAITSLVFPGFYRRSISMSELHPSTSTRLQVLLEMLRISSMQRGRHRDFVFRYTMLRLVSRLSSVTSTRFVLSRPTI